MTWDRAVARTQRALRRTFGVAVTYHANLASRVIRAAPGDVQVATVEKARGIVATNTCQWSIEAAELLPLLGDKPPARGHRIHADGRWWVVDHAQPDDAAAGGGWVVSTSGDTDASLAARGAERVS